MCPPIHIFHGFELEQPLSLGMLLSNRREHAVSPRIQLQDAIKLAIQNKIIRKNTLALII
ncbi:unnamed protein product [Linum tenue]|uniref:Uncharacterized protein n=1 Tax=Linum tenue TaxID=586396 RepID=A0AAV0M4F0_9ROSI|nr:unnamed protein product [Linum tenue]